MKKQVVLPVLVFAGLGPACVARAQLRVVSLNSSNSSSASATPRAGMQTILNSIGTTVSDDPTLAGNTGIAKPLDVLLLQEYNAPGTTGAGYANLLNSMYGTTSFAYGTLAGSSTGTGTQGIVYNSSTVQLVTQATVGTSSTSGQPRQTLRYQLRPVGYDSAADVYVYDSHFKAGSDSTSANRRNIEATAIRTDAAANLPAGANIIYAGDFNTYSGNEAMLATLMAPGGNGQAFDPINKMNWTSSSTWRNVHTQSPYDVALGSGGFTGGGMDSRFDWQMISGNLNDGRGVAYITNSYQAWGNNGTHVVSKAIDTGTGAPADVLEAESSILDHLPMVADYQLPARMGVSVGSVPSRVIAGASVPVDVTVTNTAPVAFANGADKLDYTINGTTSGSHLAALSAGNVHTIELAAPTTPGEGTFAVDVAATSEAAADANFSQSFPTTALDHAGPSLSSDSAATTKTIDFGIIGRGLHGSATQTFAVSNLASAAGEVLTAQLDLRSLTTTGDVEQLSADVASFANLAPGASRSFIASLNDSTNGTFSTSYRLNVADEDVPGSASLGTLDVHLTGIVATPGDANLDGVISFDDYVQIDTGFNNQSSGWTNGDFNGDGVVNFDDYVLIDLNFNQQNGTLARAVDWISGDDRSATGLTSTGVATMIEHLEQFGPAYGSAFLASVPEPASIALLGAAALTLSRRRGRAR